MAQKSKCFIIYHYVSKGCDSGMFYLLGTPRHQIHATHTFGEVRFPEPSLQKGLPHIPNTPLKMHHLIRQRSAEADDPPKNLSCVCSRAHVHVEVCVCWGVHTFMCACVCVCTEINSVYLSQYTSHLAFLYTGFLTAPVVQLGCPMNPRDPPGSYLPSTGVMPRFLHGY